MRNILQDLELRIARLERRSKASYPWDQCIKDQMGQYGDEDTAAKVCGKIKAQSQGLGRYKKAGAPGVFNVEDFMFPTTEFTMKLVKAIEPYIESQGYAWLIDKNYLINNDIHLTRAFTSPQLRRAQYALYRGDEAKLRQIEKGYNFLIEEIVSPRTGVHGWKISRK